MKTLKEIYLPENELNADISYSLDSLITSMYTNSVVAARAIFYEKGKGLHLSLGGYFAFMPLSEVYYSPDGEEIKEAAAATRVNKTVCAVITGFEKVNGEIMFTLSRKKAQEAAYLNYISKLCPGDVIPCTVTRLDSFGAFCDIGYGINAIIPISYISCCRIHHPCEILAEGQKIYACVNSINNGKVVLTHKELLGTWEQNAALFSVPGIATGIVSDIKPYGVFINLTANLCGLAENCADLKVGDIVKVFIKSINPENMKIKLAVTAVLNQPYCLPQLDYSITSGRMKRWQYSPACCEKLTQTVFEDIASNILQSQIPFFHKIRTA